MQHTQEKSNQYQVVKTWKKKAQTYENCELSLIARDQNE